MKTILNNEQIESYKENGYLIVNDILTGKECDEYYTQIRKHANRTEIPL